jgi:hypothetical protein
VRQRSVEHGLRAAPLPRPSKRVHERKPDGEQEARLLALACAYPPAGKARWPLRPLAERMAALAPVATLSHGTVRRTRETTRSSRT